MLRDISNSNSSSSNSLRPSIKARRTRSSTAGFQRKSAEPLISNNRVSLLQAQSSGNAAAAMAAGASTIVVPRLSQQEQEEILIMKRKVSELAKFPECFESMLGASLEERRRRDDLVINGPPNAKPAPAMLKVAQAYLKQELSRLSLGYRKQRELGEDFYRDLVALQMQYTMQFDSLLQAIATRRIEKAEAEAKLAESLDYYRKETLEMARARGEIGREGEAVLRQTEQAREALARVQAQVEQMSSHILVELLAQVKLQEEQASAHGAEAQRLQTELVYTQQQLEEEEKRQRKLSVTDSDWEQRQLQLDIVSCESKLAITKNKVEQARQECAAARSNSMQQDCELEALRQSAAEVESKISSKDGSYNATLEALMRTNEFNEKRIDKQTAEKVALQTKYEIMNSETQAARERLIQSRCTEDMLRERSEALHLRIENDYKRGAAELDAKTLAVMEEIKRCEQETAQGTTALGRIKDETELAINALHVEKQRERDIALALQTSQEKIGEMEVELDSVRSELELASGSPGALDQLLGKAKAEENLKRRAGDCLENKERVEWLKREVMEAKQALLAADAGVRVLWNELQTLKGNIRVIARIRPESPNNASSHAATTSKLVPTMDGINIELRGDQQRRPGMGAETHSFHFNRVFATDSTQHDVFEEVSEFVQSALDGYHVCLFSYGQTGSGKTWTMTGDLDSTRNRGIIPRSVDHILIHIAQMREKGWSFQVECSFVEIYNEKIRDLLAARQGGPDLEIQDVNGDILVKGMRKQAIRDAEELQALLHNANKMRSVAATNKNAQSSRSHSIFTIHLVGTHSKSGEKILGSLGLCDLAGSERLKSSLVTGERLKETQAINKSLSALSTVFGSLGRKDKHVSYRASTLTHILKPCLSGDGKTLMIVNLSSDHADAQESLCSLKFAQEVNKTELGKAKKNVQPAAAAGMARRI